MFDNEDLESVFIELNDINFGRKIIVAIYRPPGNCIDMFMSSFESIMSIVSNSKHDCLIAGDWNFDLLKYVIHSGTESFVNNLHANLLIPVITRPTTFAEFSSTLIDNILTQDLLIATAIICDISDHLPIFLSKKIQKNIKQNYFTTSYRVVTRNKIEELKTALNDNDWSELNVATGVNVTDELFINRF